jgi:hypothetical protein
MGGSSGSSSTPAWQSKEIRFAPYIEARHSSLLEAAYVARLSALDNSPYEDYTDIDYNAAVIGLGYTITSFPALYDMFGKFMSGFDVEVLWGKSFSRVMDSTGVDGKIDSEITTIDEAVEAESIPELKLLARDMNIVCSSSFIIGKALIESKRVKDLAKISAEAKFNLLQETVTGSNSELNWQKSVVDNYADLFKTFYLAASHCTDVNYKFATNDVLWNLNTLDFERAALGVFHPRSRFTKQMSSNKRRSNISKFIMITNATGQGALYGMQFGAGNPYAAAIGAAIGFHIGVSQMLIEEDKIFEAVSMNLVMLPEYTTWALGRMYNNW